MDVCLLKMPFRLAVFEPGKAGKVSDLYNYKNVYVGGHSLGGAMAANYASSHEELRGIILLAAYSTKKLSRQQLLISIYGSEDGILSTDKVWRGQQYAPDRYIERIIEGGNHAQFGNYGIQKGDGIPSISSEEQQQLAVSIIIQNIR